MQCGVVGTWVFKERTMPTKYTKCKVNPSLKCSIHKNAAIRREREREWSGEENGYQHT